MGNAGHADPTPSVAAGHRRPKRFAGAHFSGAFSQRGQPRSSRPGPVDPGQHGRFSILDRSITERKHPSSCAWICFDCEPSLLAFTSARRPVSQGEAGRFCWRNTSVRMTAERRRRSGLIGPPLAPPDGSRLRAPPRLEKPRRRVAPDDSRVGRSPGHGCKP